MDVREKMIYLVKNALTAYGKDLEKVAEPYEFIADFLIHSGVTVQEWIPVDDRFPEDDSDVLAYSSIGEESRIYPACYSNGVWFDCVFNAPATGTTTHWMPLPEPPKGE